MRSGSVTGLALIVCALSVASCSKAQDKTAPARAGSPAPATVTIGATLPLSGTDAELGRRFRDGYLTAFAELEARGGLRLGGARVPARLQLLDDGSSTASAVQQARDLIERDQVAAMLSTYGTRMVLEQSTVAEEHKVPYVISAASATGIFRRGYKFIFGLQSPTEQMAYAELRYLDNEQKAGRLPNPLKIALAWEDTAFGKDYRAGVLDFATRSESRRASYRVVLDRSFAIGERNFGPWVAQLKEARPDVFLASAHVDEFMALHRAVRGAHLCFKATSYGSRGWEEPARNEFGVEGLAHLLIATWWSNKVDAPLSRAFVDRFQQQHGRLPDFGEALGYEAARALFAAMEKAGSADREAVRVALETLDIPSLLPGANLSFPADAGRQARMLYVVQQNQPDGTQPVVYPRELATSAGTLPPCAAGLAGR